MTAIPADALTSKQRAFFDYIHANKTVCSATRRELQQKFGFRSINSVTGYLVALEKKGFVRLIPGRARNIEVVQ